MLSALPGGLTPSLNFVVDTERDVLVRHSSFAGGGFVGDVDRFEFTGPQAGDDIRIEAETFDDGEGVGVFGGGSRIGSIRDRDSVRYDAVDFGTGGRNTFTASLSSLIDTGRLEVRIDSIDGPVIATAAFPRTDSFVDFVDVDVSLARDVAGSHDVFLVFGGGVPFSAFGPGRLFLEDFLSPFVRVGDDKQVYARQLNVEGDGDQIVNDGGQLWVYGHKNENDNTTFVTSGGGVTEVLGSYIISGTNAGIASDENPLFEVVNGAMAISYREYNTGAVIDPFAVKLRSTRDGVTRELPNTRTQDMLFAAYTEDQIGPFRNDFDPQVPVPATGRIDAENFVTTGGDVSEPDSGRAGVVPSQNRTVVGRVRSGDWTGYGPVDFGGVDSDGIDSGGGIKQVTVRYAATRPGSVEVRSGGPTGTLLAEIPIRPTGGTFANFRTQTFDVPTITGIQDLYLVYRGHPTVSCSTSTGCVSCQPPRRSRDRRPNGSKPNHFPRSIPASASSAAERCSARSTTANPFATTTSTSAAASNHSPCGTRAPGHRHSS